MSFTGWTSGDLVGSFGAEVPTAVWSAGPDVSRISTTSGRHAVNATFTVGSRPITGWEIAVVASESSERGSGTVIDTVYGSTGVFDGPLAAGDSQAVLLEALDIHDASTDYGTKIIKLFIRDAAGEWHDGDWFSIEVVSEIVPDVPYHPIVAPVAPAKKKRFKKYEDRFPASFRVVETVTDRYRAVFEVKTGERFSATYVVVQSDRTIFAAQFNRSLRRRDADEQAVMALLMSEEDWE